MIIEDQSGEPVTDRDVIDAIQAVKILMIDPMWMLKLPPQVAVNLPNLHRCLTQLQEIRLSAKAPVPETPAP